MAKKYDIESRIDYTLPENIDNSSGFGFDNVVCKWTDCKFIVQDQAFRDKFMKGALSEYKDSLVFFVNLIPVDGDEPNWKTWSLGNADVWKAVDDGDYFMNTGAKGVHAKSKFHKLQNDLITAGFPKDRLKSGAQGMEGMLCLMREDKTGKKRTDKAGKEWDVEETVPAQVKSLPDMNAVVAVGGATAATSSDDTELAKTALIMLLADSGEPIAKKDIFKLMKPKVSEFGITDKQAVEFFTKVYQKDAILKSWSEIKLEGGKVSLV